MAFQLPPKAGTLPSPFSLKTTNNLNKMFDAISSGINTTGGYYSAADPNETRMYVWGHNTGSILGAAFGEQFPQPGCSLVPIKVPGSNWKTVSMGNCRVVATKTDGTAWTWGSNPHGALGIGGFSNQLSSPTQLPGTNWSRLFGGCHNSFGIKCDGTLWAWGLGDNGQLGQGCKGNQSLASPTQIPGTNWKMVSGNRHHTIGIKCDGTAWTWGNNGHGALGVCCIACPYFGTCCSPTCFCPSVWACNNGWVPCCSDPCCICPHFSSPIQLPGSNWICGLVVGGHATAGLKSDGTLWTWGHNPHGQLGLNDTCERNCPVQVPGSSWIDIGGGQTRMFARKTDNSLWGWGHSPHGEMGDGSAIPRSSPVQTICCGTTWIRLSCNIDSHHQAATKSDGTLWTWGYNPHGELGLNSTGTCYCPSQVGAATSTFWTDINTSHHGSAAIACVPSNYSL